MTRKREQPEQQPLEDPARPRDGDEVLYVPHMDSWHEDGGANFLFELVEDGPPSTTGKRARQGDIVELNTSVMGLIESRDASGTLRTERGYALRVVGPKRPWPGVLREEGTGLVLDVRQPNGIVLLHLPLSTLVHDPSGKTPHSWHRSGEAD